MLVAALGAGAAVGVSSGLERRTVTLTRASTPATLVAATSSSASAIHAADARGVVELR